MNEINEIIKKCKNFLTKSSNHYNVLIERKKRDSEIASGNFWTDTIVDSLDRKGRINVQFNQYARYSNAIVSPFSKSPYHIDIDNESGLYTEIQSICDKYENENNTKYVILQALRHASLLGTGFIVLSIIDGKIVPEIVRDVSQIALDPFIQELDGSDAEEGAIVNFISIKKAKRLYGEEVCDSHDKFYLNDFGTQWSIPEDSIPLINYYVLENDSVKLYKIVGDLVIPQQDPEDKNNTIEYISIPCSRIPIFRICYNEVIRDNKVDYNGIVDMTKDLSQGLNIAYSQLLERANRTPKASYLMPVNALDGLEEFYKKLHTKESLVTLYNGDVAPTPIIESYQTQDLMTTIDSVNTLISNVIGVPIGGIDPKMNSQTATEILIQQNNSESNINSLYENAYNAIWNMNKTILEILCWLKNLAIPEFKLVNGPNVITQKMKHRQELLAISQLVPQELQPVIAKQYLTTLDEEIAKPVISDLVANSSLNFISESTQNEDPLAVNVLNKMNMVLEQTQDELEKQMIANAELKKENDMLNLQLINQKEKNLVDIQKHIDDMNIQNRKLDIEEGKLSIEANKSQIDNDIKMTELESKQAIEQTKLQKEMISLEKEKNKIISETMKDING